MFIRKKAKEVTEASLKQDLANILHEYLVKMSNLNADSEFISKLIELYKACYEIKINSIINSTTTTTKNDDTTISM